MQSIAEGHGCRLQPASPTPGDFRHEHASVRSITVSMRPPLTLRVRSHGCACARTDCTRATRLTRGGRARRTATGRSFQRSATARRTARPQGASRPTLCFQTVSTAPTARLAPVLLCRLRLTGQRSASADENISVIPSGAARLGAVYSAIGDAVECLAGRRARSATIRSHTALRSEPLTRLTQKNQRPPFAQGASR